MHNTALYSVSNIRDLGVTVCNGMKFAVHCQKISAKAMRVSGMLFRAFSTTKPQMLLRAYCT